MIELLRNSKDKRARKLAKKRVSVPSVLTNIPSATHPGPNGAIQTRSLVGTADNHGLNYSSGRLDAQSERSTNCKVSLQSQEEQDIKQSCPELDDFGTQS